jgi:hypothetical protein
MTLHHHTPLSASALGVLTTAGLAATIPFWANAEPARAAGGYHDAAYGIAARGAAPISVRTSVSSTNGAPAAGRARPARGTGRSRSVPPPSPPEAAQSPPASPGSAPSTLWSAPPGSRRHAATAGCPRRPRAPPRRWAGRGRSPTSFTSPTAPVRGPCSSCGSTSLPAAARRRPPSASLQRSAPRSRPPRILRPRPARTR